MYQVFKNLLNVLKKTTLKKLHRDGFRPSEKIYNLIRIVCFLRALVLPVLSKHVQKTAAFTAAVFLYNVNRCKLFREREDKRMKSTKLGIKSQKLFNITIGRFDWSVSITEDEEVLQKENSFFGFGDIYVRKDLPLKIRNAVILEELAKAALIETDYFHDLKQIFDERFKDFAKALGFMLKDFLLDKSLTTILKTEARKRRYKNKVKNGHVPKKQLKFKELRLVA